MKNKRIVTQYVGYHPYDFLWIFPTYGVFLKWGYPIIYGWVNKNIGYLLYHLLLVMTGGWFMIVLSTLLIWDIWRFAIHHPFEWDVITISILDMWIMDIWLGEKSMDDKRIYVISIYVILQWVIIFMTI